MEYIAKFGFRASNNETDYEALIKGMEMAVRLGVRHLVACSDFQLVSQQIGETFEEKKERMRRYVHEVQNLSSRIERFELHHIRRS